MSAPGVMTGTGEVRFERCFPGRAEDVWPYLAQAEKRALWLAGGDDIPAEPGAEFELRFHHATLSPVKAPTPERFLHFDQPAPVRYRVLVCQPPSRLVITWGGGVGEEPSQVEFLLAQDGDRVRLTLIHSRLADAPVVRMVGAGWHTHLGILSDRLQGRDPPNFWAAFVRAEAVYAGQFEQS